MAKYIDAQEEQEKYHGKASGFWMNVLGYGMEYGSKVGGFLKDNGLLLSIQYLLSELGFVMELSIIIDP